MSFLFRMMLLLSTLAVPTIGIAGPITIRYESEIHTGNNYIAFHNSGTSGANITQILLYLGVNTIFDTNGSGLDGEAETLASSGPGNQIPVGHFTPIWSADNTAADVGLSGSLSSNVVDGANTATFNFTNFNPGKTWGFFVDMDTADNAREDPRGANLNGLLLTVHFEGVAIPLTSSCSDPNYTPERMSA